jgi:hypothetical protein
VAIITLTSDFGWADYYVGAMKGIIYQIAPQATIVDITHEIPAHDIVSGALVLREIWRTFPPKTIHVAVVDPGVGTDRKIILAQYAGQMFLVPDNGLITFIQQTSPAEQVNVVSNESLFCQPISPTFHGRDIFAPVAAHLARDVNPDQVGPRRAYVSLLDIPACQTNNSGISGQVIHVDRYGNLITNITAEQINRFARAKQVCQVRLGEKPIGLVRRVFADVERGHVVSYVGSAGMLEIAVNQGRADKELSAGPGTAVEVIS